MRAGLEESIRRLRITCEAELEQDVVTDLGPGARVTQRLVPVDRVGLYVPGGVAPLVSSVLMNVVPAQVAGVGSIALTSSPQKRPRRPAAPDDPGRLRAARHRGGVRRRRRPGDRHVRLRRRPVPLASTWSPGRATSTPSRPSGCSRASSGSTPRPGPTEIAILADDTADAAYVAADLVSQAEHDPMAASVLVTDSLRLADEVEAELDKQVAATKHVERIRTALSGEQSGIVLVDDVAQGLDVINAYAAEHTEIQTARRRSATPPRSATPAPSSSARGRRSRWATTAPAPTTCCPTAGLRLPLLGPVRAVVPARRCTSSSTPATRSREVAGHVMTLADAEDLPGHGAAVRVRFDPTRRSHDRPTTGRRSARSSAASSRTAHHSSTCRCS